MITAIVEEPLIVEFNLNEIISINGQSSYIATESGKLINNYRSGVIFPNDKITYKTDLVNKNEIPITVKPTIRVTQPGQGVFQSLNLGFFNLSNNDKVSLSEEFFVYNEGHTEITIQYEVLNATDYKRIDSVTITKHIEVLSLSDKLQSDQNNTLLAGIIVSSIIGGGTLTALYLNQKTSKIEINRLDKHNKLAEEQIKLLNKQNQELKNQFKVQNRPWITLSDLTPNWMRVNGNLIPYDQNHPATLNSSWEELDFKIEIKNIGKLPAYNLNIFTEHKFKPITINDLKKSQHIIKKLTLLPLDSVPYHFTIPMKDLNQNNKFYYGIKIEYDIGYEDNNKQFQYYVYALKKSSWETILSEIE